jgi:hypothetical protein
MFYLKNHLPDQKAIFPDSVIDEMLRPTTPQADGKNLPRYGIGWAASDIEGNPTRSHTGGMGGVSTELLLSTDHNLAIVVLVNAQNQAREITRVRNMIHNTLVPGKEKLRVFAKDGGYHGAWRGTIETYEKKIPVVLTVGEASVQMKIGAGVAQTVADVRADDEGFLWLSAVAGDLGTADAGRYPYSLMFKLKPDNGELTGSATAMSAGLSGRTGNGLSSWVKLAKD